MLEWILKDMSKNQFPEEENIMILASCLTKMCFFNYLWQKSDILEFAKKIAILYHNPRGKWKQIFEGLVTP